MSRKRPYMGPSEAESNAQALARRGLPYSAASGVSFSVSWDWHKREPRDLREAVRLVRRAHEDEVPTKLHDGPDAIGEGGTPRMTARAEGYIFGSGTETDTPLGKCTCPTNRALWTADKMAAPDVDKARATLEAATERQDYRPRLIDGIIWTATGLERHLPDCPRNPVNAPLVSYFLAPFRATLAEMERGDETCRRRAKMISHMTFGSMGPVEAALTEGAHKLDAKDVAELALRAFLRRLSDMKISVGRQREGAVA